MIPTLDELDTALTIALESETESLFLQGDIIRDAITRGMDNEQVYGRFSYISRRGKRTAQTRHKVSTVFPTDQRNPELDYFIHAICAEAADIRKPDTFSKAQEWLKIASEGYQNERGEKLGHTCRTLKLAMKSAGLDPDKNKEVFLLDRAECEIVNIENTADSRNRDVAYVTLRFYNRFLQLPEGDVLVTMVQPVNEAVQTSALEQEVTV